jgi:tRNA-dihydrouridine synthase B
VPDGAPFLFVLWNNGAHHTTFEADKGYQPMKFSVLDLAPVPEGSDVTDAMRNTTDLAQRAEGAGIAMITIHGRTRCQFYKGHANWAAISNVKDSVEIPVIANGDIVNGATARTALEASRADGVMVGRGAQGKPWIIAQIASELFGTEPPHVPVGCAKSEMIINHYEEMLEFYGQVLGLRVARKHLGWYIESAAPDLRRAILTAKSPTEVIALIPEAVGSSESVAA